MIIISDHAMERLKQRYKNPDENTIQGIKCVASNKQHYQLIARLKNKSEIRQIKVKGTIFLFTINPKNNVIITFLPKDSYLKTTKYNRKYRE